MKFRWKSFHRHTLKLHNHVGHGNSDDAERLACQSNNQVTRQTTLMRLFVKLNATLQQW